MQDLLEYLNKKGIESLKQEFNIRIKQKDNLYLLKYDQIISPLHNPIVKQCRGTIVKNTEEGFKYVARPFDKFFNLEEKNTAWVNIAWVYDNILLHHDLSVQEKLDGTCIVVSYYNDEWHISTLGCIESGEVEKGVRFSQLVYPILRPYLSTMNKNLTYLFEYCSPYNRIVVSYKNEKLTLIGIRETISGVEFLPNRSFLPFLKANTASTIDVISTFKKSSNWIKNKLDKMNGTKQEGFVLLQLDIDKYGRQVVKNRVKVKCSDYILKHQLASKVSNQTKNLISLVLKDTFDLQEYIIMFPYLEDKFKNIINSIKTLLNEIEKEYTELEKERSKVSNFNKFIAFNGTKEYLPFFFNKNKHNKDFLQSLKQLNINKVESLLKL